MHATYQQAVKSANKIKKALGPMWSSRVFKTAVGPKSKQWRAQARIDKPGIVVYVQKTDDSGMYVCRILVGAWSCIGVGKFPDHAFVRARMASRAEFKKISRLAAVLEKI